MTESWDKLWEERKSHYYNLNTNTADFIHCVKIEGDRLKDELRRYKNSFHIIKLAGGKEVQLAQKLEAIETFIRAKAKSNDPAYSICVGVISILEGEG